MLVDGNLQFGDVAVFVNEQGKNTILDIAPRVDDLDVETANDILIKHKASGIRILAAPQRPEQAEQVSPDQFAKVLQYLQKMFAYVVVDTSCILTDPILSAMDVSDLVVLITTQEIPAIKNSRLILDLFTTMGVGKDKIIFAMNRYDKRVSISPERVSENLKHEVLAVIPLDEKTAITAVNRGVPFMLDNKTQPIGRGILTLAEMIRSRVLTMDNASESPAMRR